MIDTTALPTGALLAERLEAAGYPRPFMIGGVSLTIIAPDSSSVAQGSVITCGAAGTVLPAPAPSHLVFVVRSGPDAGQVVPLRRGTYTIGRTANDITLSDPCVSRRQAHLTVTKDSILLEDVGSVNGSFVDEECITRAQLTVASRIRLGTSRCSIDLMDGDPWRPDPEDALEPITVGAAPGKPPGVLTLTAFLPLVLGVVLALTTGMWFFLAFSALSAVTGLIPLITYRRASAAFEEVMRDAVLRDHGRRTRAVPDAGQTVLDAVRATEPGRPSVPATGPPDPRTPRHLLRLGTAHQPANLLVERARPPFAVPNLRDSPFLVPVQGPGADGRTFTITGNPEAAQALVRAILLQLSHPNSPPLRVVCWATLDDVPHQARFLPHVRITHDPRVLLDLTRSGEPVLVLRCSAGLPAIDASAPVFTIGVVPEGSGCPESEDTPCPTGDHILLRTDGRASAVLGARSFDVEPDGVSARVFDWAARALGRSADHRTAARYNERTAPGLTRSLPVRASVWTPHLNPDVLRDRIPTRWDTADPGHLLSDLGVSAAGTLSIDLVTDGPHLLVAGTTGSGKSELLRTLVLGLALNQPPDNLTLLLIDYKGGAGLGVLTSLPHCVGSLSDLSSESTARALVSLRAELRRREALCADNGAADLDELRRTCPALCPPRLVVVIDEFRALIDDVATAVTDLARIAALGRSLGVHLVLATQRAQGAVTPDLRSNVTSSILLRVQTALESQDLLGSAVASDLPVGTPGRAFFRRGSDPPIAFQVASSTEAPPIDHPAGWMDLREYLGGGPARVDAERTAAPVSTTHEQGSAGPDGPTTLPGATPDPMHADGIFRRVAANLSDLARDRSTPRPHCPVLQPLPAVLSTEDCRTFPDMAHRTEAGQPRGMSEPGSAGGPPPVGLGVIDAPDRQDQRRLVWHPADHSHLAFVGLPGSGAVEAMAAATAALTEADPDLHLYLLDGDGSLGQRGGEPQVGAYVAHHETRRAARVLERLSALPVGSATGHSIVLAVTGWGRWAGSFRQGRLARAEEDLHTLLRDGSRCGVTVLLSGEREITASRFFSLLPNRIYLPLGAHQETTLTWPKMPPVAASAGRGFAQGRITGALGDNICQLVLAAPPPARPPRPPINPPFPVHPLPTLLTIGDLRRRAGRPIARSSGVELALGVHGDELSPYSIVARDGESFLILGQASTGRTNALRVLHDAASRLPGDLRILPAPSGSTLREQVQYWRSVDVEWSAVGDGTCLVLVDDTDDLPMDVQQVLSGLVAHGAAVIAAARPGPSLMARVPLALQARSFARGFVLSPTSPTDGDFFGVRLDVEPTGIAGRGVACTPQGVQDVQVAVMPAPRSSRQ
ncbi:FtsK/SpoIIIE domain-containing protein [Arthrobacter agilis]|uniref:FtsK/SpoIIIE domain-containing protein n=1 Tax=Arthrobacter agilis TaxID=37921 RepID=UPI00112CBF6F|nr:FtsK/SpoIIIE domain-containing protein [Arthrobacter agilis]